MDHFMIGKRCVNCEVIEADGKGRQPDEDDFNESSRSLLDVIVERNDKVHVNPHLHAFQCDFDPVHNNASILVTAENIILYGWKF